MSKIKVVIWVLGFSFVVLLLDGMRQSLALPGSGTDGGLMPTAAAAGASCAVPQIERLSGDWAVKSTGCNSVSCRQPHLDVGDRLTFEQDISGVQNFSLRVQPSKSGRRGSHTEGTTLESDGIGNVTGPIVLDHSPLDGTPLQIHWLIIKLRAYDADGLGDCRVRALIAVCDEQPTSRSAVCTDRQHGGLLHADPV